MRVRKLHIRKQDRNDYERHIVVGALVGVSLGDHLLNSLFGFLLCHAIVAHVRLRALAQSIQTRRMRERGEIPSHHTSTKTKKSKLELEAETAGNPDEQFDD